MRVMRQSLLPRRPAFYGLVAGLVPAVVTVALISGAVSASAQVAAPQTNVREPGVTAIGMAMSRTYPLASLRSGTGTNVINTSGLLQGAVTGPDGRVWLLAALPSKAPGLAAVNPFTHKIRYYRLPSALPGLAGSLDYDGGPPAFDRDGNAWVAIHGRSKASPYYRLVRFTPATGKYVIYRVPSACDRPASTPEDLTAASDGSVWASCMDEKIGVTNLLLRVAPDGKISTIKPEHVSPVSAFMTHLAPGANGTMWAAVGVLTGADGLAEFSGAGHESYYPDPPDVSSDGVAGNGAGPVADLATCSAGVTFTTCYERVAADGKLTRIANGPDDPGNVTARYGPIMDRHGDIWTLDDVPASRNPQIYVEVTPGGSVKTFPFQLPHPYELDLAAPVGAPAITGGGAAWVETSAPLAYRGKLIQFTRS